MRIAGVLVDGDGAPVAGATVWLAAAARANTAEDHCKTTRAPDGTFAFAHLLNGGDSHSIDRVHPGRYRATFDGRSWTEVKVAPAPEKQTFDLRALR